MRRAKMTAWWAFMGRTAEKPTGLAKQNTSSENEIPPLKMKYLL
jgi:hypothetical protein